MPIPKKPPQAAPGRKMKRTPQRLAILDYLEGNTKHPSAEEIYRAVSRTYQSMSFATVYNTLKALTGKGMLRELTIDPDRKRYDPDTSPHHHFICLQCRKIVDVHAPLVVEPPREMAKDHVVVGTHVEFTGLCPSCKKRKRTQ